MEEVNLVSEAIKFMALGMGVVFLFLMVMIFALKLQTFLIAKFFPEKKQEVCAWKPENKTVVDDRDTTAAITAAIIHYNNQKGK